MHFEETTTDSGVAEKEALITPYGGKLVNLVVPADELAELRWRVEARRLSSQR